MDERKNLIKQLRAKLMEYKTNGGNLDVLKRELPNEIIALLNKILKLDRAKGLPSNINDIIEEAGFYRKSVKQDITFDRLKKEIDEHIANGNSIYNPKRELPYYELLNGYRKKTGLNTKEIYKLCGYEYDETLAKTRRLNTDIWKILNSLKDENGYVDSVFNIEDSHLLMRTMRYDAKKEDIPFNNYLMLMFGVRLKSSMEQINYLEEVENLLHDYVRKYGKENLSRQSIEKNEPNLVRKIRHLAEYFPEGTITYHQLLEYFGCEPTTNRTFELTADERSYLDDLLKAYPDRKLGSKFYKTTLYRRGLNFAVKNDLTAKQYFNLKGFKYDDGYNTFSLSRLSKMVLVIDNEEIYEKILNHREKLLDKYDYYNQKDEMVKNQILNKIFNECKEKFNDQIKLKPRA